MTEEPTTSTGEAPPERNRGLKGVVVHRLVGGFGAAAIASGREVRFLGAARLEPSPEIKDYFRRMEAAQQRAFTKSFRVGAANVKAMASAEEKTSTTPENEH